MHSQHAIYTWQSSGSMHICYCSVHELYFITHGQRSVCSPTRTEAVHGRLVFEKPPLWKTFLCGNAIAPMCLRQQFRTALFLSFFLCFFVSVFFSFFLFFFLSFFLSFFLILSKKFRPCDVGLRAESQTIPQSSSGDRWWLYTKAQVCGLACVLELPRTEVTILFSSYTELR